MDAFWLWAGSIPWFAWIAIVAILCGTATAITRMIIDHRERLERIRAGDLPLEPKN